MFYFKKNQIIYYLLALIFPGLILGPFLPDLIISISVLIFLFYIFRKKNFSFFKKKPLKFFFIFCIYCIFITLLRAEDKLLSFESSLFYFRIGVFACLIWFLIEKNKKIINIFYNSLLVSFVILTIDGYYQFFNGSNILGFPLNGTRVSSFFGDELILGSYLSRLFPLFFAFFLVKKKKKYEKYYIGILFVLIDILIFISGERTAFFFLNLSTIFIIIFIKEYQKFRIITFLSAILIISGLSFIDNDLSNRMIKDPIDKMGFTQNQTKYIFGPIHDSMIKTAYNMFLDKPFFGHGPKMFRVICKKEKYQVGSSPCSTHPHNFYIQLLSETGLIGFLFLFSVFVYVVYCSFLQFKSVIFNEKRYLTDYQVCLLSAILVTIWPFSPNGNFFNNWLMVIYSLPIGFYFHSIYSKKKYLKKNCFF